MKRKKTAILLCCITLGVSTILGGCGGSTSNDTSGNTKESDSGQSDSETASGETTIFGQISSIDGNTITIALAETPQRAGGAEGSTEMNPGEMPEGATEMGQGELPEGATEMGQGELPEGATEMSPGEMPEGSTEMNPGEAPEGSTEMQQGGNRSGGMGLSLTGEEQTITVDDSTTITVQSGDSSTDGSISDLAENDIVTVTMDGDTVVSITVGGGMGAGGKGDFGKNKDSAEASTEE